MKIDPYESAIIDIIAGVCWANMDRRFWTDAEALKFLSPLFDIARTALNANPDTLFERALKLDKRPVPGATLADILNRAVKENGGTV